METANPYRPPASSSPDATPASGLIYVVRVVPAMLSVGLTLLLWVTIVRTLERFLGSPGGHRVGILVWAVTLYLSSSISTTAISRILSIKTLPLAHGVAFSIFGIVFLLAEGDTSNGADPFQRAVVYGALISLPVAMYLLASSTARSKRNAPELPAADNNPIHPSGEFGRS